MRRPGRVGWSSTPGRCGVGRGCGEGALGNLGCGVVLGSNGIGGVKGTSEGAEGCFMNSAREAPGEAEGPAAPVLLSGDSAALPSLRMAVDGWDGREASIC
eukprot:762716-Hanusia_phi.AAC.3